MSADRYANRLPNSEAPTPPTPNKIVPTAGAMANRRPVVPSRKGLEVKSTATFSVHPIGLEIVGQPTEDEWELFGRALVTTESGIQWIYGDWYLSANHEWGAYKQFADDHNIEWRRLEDYIYVCRNVDFTVRTVELSFSHHRAVAPLYDSANPVGSQNKQRAVLAYAIERGLSVTELKAAIALDEINNPPALPSDVVIDDNPMPRWEKPVQQFEARLARLWGKMEKPERVSVISYLESLLTTLKAQE